VILLVCSTLEVYERKELSFHHSSHSNCKCLPCSPCNISFFRTSVFFNYRSCHKEAKPIGDLLLEQLTVCRDWISQPCFSFTSIASALEAEIQERTKLQISQKSKVAESNSVNSGDGGV
jgi:hypothetical protein